MNDAPAAERVPSPIRKWVAIGVGTVAASAAYWFLVLGLAALFDEADGLDPNISWRWFIMLGFLMVPGTLAILSYFSWRPSPGIAVLNGTALVVLFTGALIVLGAPEPITPLAAGLGAGGVATIHAQPHHSWKRRAVAVAIAAVYIFVILQTVPFLGLVMAPFVPFNAVGLADFLADRRLERAVARET
jgi:hypothetical protein